MSSSPAYLSSTPLHRVQQWRWSSDNAIEERSIQFAPQKVHLEPENYDLTVLKEKQRSLRNHLSAVQEQQLQENLVNFPRAVFSLAHPDSVEMIIYGLQEQLERIAQEIAAHHQQTSMTYQEEIIGD